MRLGALPAFACALALLAAPRPAGATATQELAKARAEYARSEYDRTVKILSTVLADPRQKADLSERETIEAHKLLGLSYFFMSQSAPAEEQPALLELASDQFYKLLFIDPDYVLDAGVEGPDAAAFFDQVKRDAKKQLDEIRKQKQLDEEKRKRPQRERLVIKTVKDAPGWSNWVPLGYPQFRNGEDAKGTVFLVVGGAALFTSAYFYLQHSFRYGWPVGELPTDPAEIEQIQREQYIQIGAGVVFLALWGYGIYDGYLHQPPTLTISESIEPIKYDDEPKAGAARDQRRRGGPLLVPLFTGDAFGLGVAWEL